MKQKCHGSTESANDVYKCSFQSRTDTWVGIIIISHSGCFQWVGLVMRLLQFLRHFFLVNVSCLLPPTSARITNIKVMDHLHSAPHLADNKQICGPLSLFLFSLGATVCSLYCIYCLKTVLCVYFSGSSMASHLFWLSPGSEKLK